MKKINPLTKRPYGMKKYIKYAIWLWSEIAGKYAPTQQPLKDTANEARVFAKRTLKLEQNLSGKAAFEVRPETVWA